MVGGETMGEAELVSVGALVMAATVVVVASG